MKKMFKAAASLAVGCALLSTSAFAALTGTVPEKTTNGSATVTVDGLGTGESTIMVLKGVLDAMPATIADDDIVYINQTTADNGSATYNITPGTRKGDATAVTVFAGGTNESTATKLGTISLLETTPAESIVLTGTGIADNAATLTAEDTLAITATVSPEAATDKTVIWKVMQGDVDVTTAVLGTPTDTAATFTAPTVAAATVYTLTATDSAAHVATLTITVNPKAQEPSYTLGDVNNDGTVDASDALAIINYFLKGVEFTDSNGDAVDVAAGDVNGDTAVDASDALAVINYFLKGTAF